MKNRVKGFETIFVIGDTMKKRTVFILVCVIGALAMAAKEETKSEDVQKRAPQIRRGAQDRIQRPNPIRGRGSFDPQDRRRGYQQMLARRAEMNAAAIAELDAIKKIAEEEGATRTVEAIQALIDKKNAEFKKQMTTMEKQRRERAGQIQQRTERNRSRTERGQMKKADTPRDSESKATPDKADKEE